MPIDRRRAPQLIAAAAILAALVLAALFTVQVPGPAPAVAPLIKVRWVATLDEAGRAAREAQYRLRRGALHSELTWNYDLLDTSPANIRALVSDAAAADTDGLDRQAFRVPVPPVPLAERVGLASWMSRDDLWPALLAIAWLAALGQPRVRGALFRGVPALSPLGLGLFRFVFGVTLLLVLPAAIELPPGAFPRELHRSAGWFADREIVHWLAAHAEVTARLMTAGRVALACFALGIVPRVSYAIAVFAITACGLVRLLHTSAHDIGLPLVVLWGLLVVRWDAWLTLLPPRWQQPGRDDRLGFAIWFPGAAIGLAFLAAAYAKLDTSGLDWVLGGAVKYHLVEDFRQAPTAWGLWIATHPGIAVALSAGAIAIESLFVLHAFSAHAGVRAAFGAAGLALLLGFYALQGVLWPLWWTLFAVFIPWSTLARRLEPRAGQALAVVTPTAPQIAVVALLVCVQIGASARRREIEPFISDYGMYSWTWPSVAAFDRNNARKYRQYRYLTPASAAAVDVTARLRELPEATDVLTDAIDRLRDGDALPDDQRRALRAIGQAYAAAYREAPPSLTVLVDEQAFDWARGVFYRRANGATVGTLDLDSGGFQPAASNEGGRLTSAGG